MTLPPDWTHWRDQVDLDGYDERWARIEAEGGNPHGEADLVRSLGPRSVLDGGCGTGRVGIELARHGIAVLGVDPDPDMVAAAREKAPGVEWLELDLADLDRPERFDVAVLAGNVIPYATRRAEVVAGCARHLVAGGRLVAGFQLQDGWPTLAEYDGWCAAAGLSPHARWSTWDRLPYEGGDYVVAVHVRAGVAAADVSACGSGSAPSPSTGRPPGHPG
ncbi:class I SAM-dependent DNA methyltransferase [Pseudonocardia abyssalis]|uniref:class I SAM-dependent DNA methyltransferase n=1 Tax=Pseudonocardia abyssalis TaxID=2792008 RepID=UPI001C4A1479|nr:class I SAM-dependent methyltransferase [Pseudonocardia abyssalis]